MNQEELRHVELPAATSTALLPGVEVGGADLRRKQDNQVAIDARLAFEFWRETLQHPRAILDRKRLRVVSDRLKEGFTLDQLKAAITGCARSPWHQGGNPDGKFYDGIALICRDAEHVEMFIRQGDNDNGGLQRQERQAPLTANSQRLLASFAGIARRAATEAGSDDTGGQDFTGLTLLR
jgi:hypothetical protein